MNLKNCPCCKRPQTTRNSEFKGRMELGAKMLLFNCKSCFSTFAIVAKKPKKEVA